MPPSATRCSIHRQPEAQGRRPPLQNLRSFPGAAAPRHCRRPSHPPQRPPARAPEPAQNRRHLPRPRRRPRRQAHLPRRRRSTLHPQERLLRRAQRRDRDGLAPSPGTVRLRPQRGGTRPSARGRGRRRVGRRRPPLRPRHDRALCRCHVVVRAAADSQGRAAKEPCLRRRRVHLLARPRRCAVPRRRQHRVLRGMGRCLRRRRAVCARELPRMRRRVPPTSTATTLAEAPSPSSTPAPAKRASTTRGASTALRRTMGF